MIIIFIVKSSFQLPYPNAAKKDSVIEIIYEMWNV